MARVKTGGFFPPATSQPQQAVHTPPVLYSIYEKMYMCPVLCCIAVVQGAVVGVVGRIRSAPLAGREFPRQKLLKAVSR